MRTLRIGTRRSQLATVQAEQVRRMLRHQDVDAELVPMTTSGDRASWPEQADLDPSPLTMKALWIDTILQALRTGEIDLAVHSAKDLPADDDDDLTIGAVPERADPHDVLVFHERSVLEKGMVVGTSSIRRRAQILAAYPGVGIAELRGNVDTRLRKLEEGEVDVAVLAAAGLERLGLIPPHARTLAVWRTLCSWLCGSTRRKSNHHLRS
ncbi:MAG: hydroxymethylbilane synthase [Actinomycetota bacterium]